MVGSCRRQYDDAAAVVDVDRDKSGTSRISVVAAPPCRAVRGVSGGGVGVRRDDNRRGPRMVISARGDDASYYVPSLYHRRQFSFLASRSIHSINRWSPEDHRRRCVSRGRPKKNAISVKKFGAPQMNNGRKDYT